MNRNFESPDVKKEQNADLTHIMPSPPKSILKLRSLRTSVGFQPSSSKVCFTLNDEEDATEKVEPKPILNNIQPLKLLLSKTKSLIASITSEGSPTRDLNDL